MGRRIPGRIGQIESQVYGSNSLLTDPQSYLSEEDRALADALGVGAGQVTEGQARDASAEVEAAKARQRQVDVEAGQARQNTEKQALVENVIAGLGKALAGVLGEQQGFSSEGVNIKTSDFGQLLAGRMQEIAEKRKTAQSEMESAERRKADLFGAGRRQLELKQMSAKDRNEMVFRAMLQEHFMNREAAERKDREADKDKEATLGSISALTQSIGKQSTELSASQKALRERIGDLRNKDSAKVLEAKREIASMTGNDPTAFEDLDNEAVEARAMEFAQKSQARGQALQKFSEKLALKTASKKPFTDDERKAISLLSSGLQPTEEGTRAGEVLARSPESLSFTEAMGAVSANPKLEQAFGAYINKISNTPLFSADPEAIDIIQKKVQSGRISELSAAEMKELNKYKDDKGRSLIQGFFSQKVPVGKDKVQTIGEVYKNLVKTSADSEDYDTLQKLAPGSKVSVKGFGQ
jgi:hypothetical protein